MEKGTCYEAPPYAVFSNLLSLHPSSAKIFSSAPSVHVPPLIAEENIGTKREETRTLWKLFNEELTLLIREH
jgi:hypothetical protein